MFSKILIANRGEIAVRVARSARRLGVTTVAIYSDADRDAMHVEACDEAVCIGGVSPAESYLNAGRILEVQDGVIDTVLIDQRTELVPNDTSARLADYITDEQQSHFAYSIDRVSLITVTLICPG